MRSRLFYNPDQNLQIGFQQKIGRVLIIIAKEGSMFTDDNKLPKNPF